MTDENENHVCDSCRQAVLRVFRELWLKGEDEETALRAALHILSLRHPDQTPETRATDVLRWLLEDQPQGSGHADHGR